MAIRSYPTLPPRTYLPPAVDSRPFIPNGGLVDFTTTSTTTTTTTTTMTTTTTTTTTTVTTSTTTTANTYTTDSKHESEVVMNNMIDDGDENGHTHDDMEHDLPSQNDIGFVLVEPVQQTQLPSMKT